MKSFLPRFFFLLLIALFAYSALLSGKVSVSEAQEAGVKVMQREELGEFLASGDGMTLYSYKKDEAGISNCVEGCAVNWPPFYVDPSAVVEGCEASNFATITRSDGRKQTTYKEMPLYHFINDKYPADTFGHGLGDVWYIVNP